MATNIPNFYNMKEAKQFFKYLWRYSSWKCWPPVVRPKIKYCWVICPYPLAYHCLMLVKQLQTWMTPCKDANECIPPCCEDILKLKMALWSQNQADQQIFKFWKQVFSNFIDMEKAKEKLWVILFGNAKGKSFSKYFMCFLFGKSHF